MTMLEDKRPIQAVFFNDEDNSSYQIGIFDCTKIEVYAEPGEYCSKPWIAVYRNEKIYTRIPANMVQIVYQ